MTVKDDLYFCILYFRSSLKVSQNILKGNGERKILNQQPKLDPPSPKVFACMSLTKGGEEEKQIVVET